MNIYTNNNLKYPLESNEVDMLPKVWKFLEVFKKRFVFISDYRNHLVKQIQDKYTIDEFYKYEYIINKLFWNLRWGVSYVWTDEKLDTDNMPLSLLICKFVKYKDTDDLIKKVKEVKSGENIDNIGSFYRSFINKLIIVDKENKELIIKQMEGSSDIFSKNYFNLLTSHILFSKKLYEEVMNNPLSIKNKDIKLSEYYYQYDYGFPNLNYCKYLIGSENDRLERIKKMYYNINNPYKYWFKIIL